MLYIYEPTKRQLLMCPRLFASMESARELKTVERVATVPLETQLVLIFFKLGYKFCFLVLVCTEAFVV